MPADAASSVPGIAARDTAAPARPATPSAGASMHRRRRRGPAFWGGVALGLLAIAAGAALYWRAHRGPATTYATAALDRGTVARAVTASGTVNPVLTIVVGSYISGVIQEIRCDYNTPVRKGQVCATIDPRPYRMAVDQEAAALGTVRAQLVKDVATLAYAEASAARYARLLAEDSIARDTAENAPVRAARATSRARAATSGWAILRPSRWRPSPGGRSTGAWRRSARRRRRCRTWA